MVAIASLLQNFKSLSIFENIYSKIVWMIKFEILLPQKLPAIWYDYLKFSLPPYQCSPQMFSRSGKMAILLSLLLASWHLCPCSASLVLEEIEFSTASTFNLSNF